MSALLRRQIHPISKIFNFLFPLFTRFFFPFSECLLVLFMLWFHFTLSSHVVFLYFKLIIIPYHSKKKQWKTKADLNNESIRPPYLTACIVFTSLIPYEFLSRPNFLTWKTVPREQRYLYYRGRDRVKFAFLRASWKSGVSNLKVSFRR